MIKKAQNLKHMNLERILPEAKPEKIETIHTQYRIVPPSSFLSRSLQRMPSFDQTFANGQIDFITENSYKMVELYKILRKQPANQERITQLSNMYISVMKAISQYYEYLEKTHVKPEESYLTHWLENDASPEYFEDIVIFLEDCR